MKKLLFLIACTDLLVPLASCVSDPPSGPLVVGEWIALFSFKDSSGYTVKVNPIHLWLSDSSQFTLKFLSASLDTSVFTYTADTGMKQVHEITFTPKVREALKLPRDTALWKIDVDIEADNAKGRVDGTTVSAWLGKTK